MPEILVLYYSHRGSVQALAQQIARGIESTGSAAARLRTVPKVSAVCTASEPQVPVAGAPYVEAADLEQCIGLALGSPTRFGNMAAPMKYLLGRHREPMVRRGAGRQTRLRVYLHRQCCTAARRARCCR
jgi:NAD(P)H dehydrogenase (quinone)